MWKYFCNKFNAANNRFIFNWSNKTTRFYVANKSYAAPSDLVWNLRKRLLLSTTKGRFALQPTSSASVRERGQSLVAGNKKLPLP